MEGTGAHYKILLPKGGAYYRRGLKRVGRGLIVIT